MASQVPPKKNTAFTLYFTLYKSDGTVIANPGTYTKKISKDGGAIADISASVTEVDTTYGLCSLVISSTEMNADAVWIQIKDDTTGCVPFTTVLYTSANLMDDIKTDTAAIKTQTDKLPASPAAVGSAMTLTSAYDAAKSAASQASVTTINGIVDDILVDTGTTLPATLTALPAAIWNHLLSAMSTVGSVGLRLAQWLTIIPDDATAYGATDLSICNNALVQLGNEPLLNLTDTTKKAVRLCVQFYDQTVEEVLRAYNWNCATVRDTLTVDETAPEWGYNYRYALPADCLRVIGFSSASVNWKIENGYILADTDGGEISYIKLITAADMDALLRSAVSARLAAYLAFPLTNSATVAKAMFDLYKEKLADAHTMDAFENGTGEHLASDSWIHARGQ